MYLLSIGIESFLHYSKQDLENWYRKLNFTLQFYRNKCKKNWYLYQQESWLLLNCVCTGMYNIQKIQSLSLYQVSEMVFKVECLENWLCHLI